MPVAQRPVPAPPCDFFASSHNKAFSSSTPAPFHPRATGPSLPSPMADHRHDPDGYTHDTESPIGPCPPSASPVSCPPPGPGKVHVKFLPHKCTPEEVYALFAPCGEIVGEARLMYNNANGNVIRGNPPTILRPTPRRSAVSQARSDCIPPALIACEVLQGSLPEHHRTRRSACPHPRRLASRWWQQPRGMMIARIAAG